MSVDTLHSSSDSPGRHCPRCRQPADPESVQCETCGEILSGPARRKGPSNAKQIFAAARPAQSAGAAAVVDTAFAGGAISAPPTARIFRWTALASGGCFLLAALCYGLAWVVRSLSTDLLSAMTWLGAAGVALIPLSIIVTVLWKLIYSVEMSAVRSAAKRDARLRASIDVAARTAYSSTESKLSKPAPAYYNYDRPTVAPRRPSPGALSFAILAIVCGSIALLFSMFPALGYFTFLPLIPAGVFTVIALVLSFHERSQKLLPVIALMLTVLSVIGMEVQRAYWKAQLQTLEIEARLREEQQRQELEQSLDRLGQTVNSSLNSISKWIPTPPKLTMPATPTPTPRPRQNVYRPRATPRANQ